MRRPKMKRNFWRSNEVKCMLGVFKDLNVVQLLEQKTIPINDIYKRVELEMGQRGFSQKNGKQIQSKWSQMKSAYICIKRNHKADFYKMKDPEFREEVAELVEADLTMRVSLPPLPEGVSLSPSPSKSYHDDTVSSLPDETFESENEITPDLQDMQDMSFQVDEPIEEPPPVVVRKGKKSNIASVRAPCFVPVSAVEDAMDTQHRQGSYKKSFWRFMQQMKALELDLQEEFVTKQKRLLEEERRLQIQRDNQIIASFAASTNQILKSTQELIEKGFSR